MEMCGREMGQNSTSSFIKSPTILQISLEYGSSQKGYRIERITKSMS